MKTIKFCGSNMFRHLLAVIGLAACSLGQAADVGQVTFAAGTVTITNAAGVSRSAGKAAPLAVGDTVTTAAGSRAQLLFSDGADVALQPDTVYRIEDYRYSGKPDGNELGVFRLVKGALRTVTGLIGRNNRDAYRVNTATATIGIRGTEYTARFTDVLRVSVTQGLVAMINQGGEVVVGPGQSGLATSITTRPELTIEGAQLRAPGLPQPFHMLAAESRNGEGYSVVLSGSSEQEQHSSSGGGTMFAAAMGDLSNIGASAGAYFAGATSTDYSLVATGNDISEFRYFNFQGMLGSATVAESGSVAGISYGRWTTPGATASDFSNTYTNPNVAYVFANQNAVPLPVSGTATLTAVASTSPVNAAGTTGTFLGATLALNFAATTNAVTLTNLQASVNGALYTVNSTSSSGFYPGDSGRINIFSSSVSCSGSCGSTGLDAKASGLVVNGGAAAGLTYSIADPTGANKSVVGAVVFTPSGSI